MLSEPQYGNVTYLEDIPSDWHRSILEVISDADGNISISIPEDLGGGSIVEEDYVLSNFQLDLFDKLLMVRNVSAVIETDRGNTTGRTPVSRNFSDESTAKIKQLKELLDSPKFDYDGVVATSHTVQAWETLEVLRILRPLSENFNSAITLGRVLTDHQVDFLKRYDTLARAATISAQAGDNLDSRERLTHVFDELTELEYRRKNGMMYNDGSHEDPYLRRQLELRLLTTEAGHGEGYFETKIGRTTLAIIDGGVKPDDIIEQEDAIAVLDALHASRGLSNFLARNYIEPLRLKAKFILGRTSYYVAEEARTPGGVVAHPRLTTGNGTPTLTRPDPGV